ncbi:TIGR02206 family membrane protein [Paenibacillus sp. Marseille-Q4541]|uniref:YwaF family protein n=1 Tax=Paenibacillus sp. Marseille-Q4541 TaxID=2831522 RepID=UPI0020197C02|nr:TIGR02206 family membrane protein [Paenibacillus sp. Marseille-Q4541]
MYSILSYSSIFNPFHAPPFEFMSTFHIAALLIIVVVILALFLYRTQLRYSSVWKQALRWGLIIILFLSQVTLEIWYRAYAIWDMKYTLPLELCSITLILSIVMLITRNRILYILVFYAGICGALAALVTPNLAYTFPHFRFIQFFIAHGAIILSALYMTWIENYRLTFRSVPIAFILLNIVAGVVWIINQMTGANYMFLSRKPDTPSVLDVLGPYPRYILMEEMLALTLFLMLYVLFFYLPSRRVEQVGDCRERNM